MRDVAALAGVPAKTVSDVANGYAFVAPENRRRVTEACVTLVFRSYAAAAARART
jgi:DNA-binding LacI/PurR family transcriptional regulator